MSPRPSVAPGLGLAVAWGLAVAVLGPRLGGLAARAVLDHQAVGWLGCLLAYAAACRVGGVPRRLGPSVGLVLLTLAPWVAAGLREGAARGDAWQAGVFAAVLAGGGWLAAPWAARRFRR